MACQALQWATFRGLASLWHTAPFCGCMQVEKPCLSNAPDVLASQCLTLRACFSFMSLCTYYVLAGQRQVPEVQIYVIYACTLWLFYQARLKEYKLHKLWEKSNCSSLVWLHLQERSQRELLGAWSEREEKAIPNTEIKQSSNSSLCCHCMNHKVPVVSQLIYWLVQQHKAHFLLSLFFKVVKLNPKIWRKFLLF